MREATGATTTMKLAIIFTIIFAGFLVVAITYNRAFKLKNESLSILEKYEGVSNNSISILNNYLKNSGYSTKGNCSDGEYGISDLDKSDYEKAKSSEKYYYCLRFYCSNTTCRISTDNRIYYKVKLFFKFNLPFFGDISTYSITGETKPIKLYSESQKFK